MKLISGIQNDPAVLLTLVIILISICIIIVVIILLYRLENEKRVTRAALELKKITNSIRAGLIHFILEDNCKILYASKGFYDVLGYDKNVAKEGNKVSILDFIDPRNTDFVHKIEQQLGNETIRCEIPLVTKGGNLINMLMTGNSSTGRDGKHTLSVVFVDISEQKKMQELILLEGERYRIATELSNDILFEYHIKTDEMIHTDKYKDIFGAVPVIQNYRKNCEKRRDQIHPDDWGIYLEFCQELAEGASIIESQFRIKDRLGEFIWCQIMGKTIHDDYKMPIRVIGKIVNVDTQKRELEALEYKATRDPLTGVYNKEVTIKKIDKYITGNKNGMHMLMLIDFDDFKSINDNYGHLQGDKILIFVISRIKEVFSEGEIIGRIGGDEFVVFAGNISCVDEVIEKATLLRHELDTTYTSDKTTIKISGSIGVSIYPEDGLHYEQLMDLADKALYQVKEHGKNDYMIYSSAT
ncbi:MAG TPA: diguanylate cyclase [Mobilitalea sp.]|nr:diguanylate cyclase [Mobilitalea sp.]